MPTQLERELERKGKSDRRALRTLRINLRNLALRQRSARERQDEQLGLTPATPSPRKSPTRSR